MFLLDLNGTTRGIQASLVNVGQLGAGRGQRESKVSHHPQPLDPRTWEFEEGNKEAEPSPSPSWASL